MMNRRDFVGCAAACAVPKAFGEASSRGSAAHSRIRLALFGLAHDHARYALPGILKSSDFELVGIFEPDLELRHSYAARFKLDTELFYDDLDTLCQAAHPHAVWAFARTATNRSVIEQCAQRQLHVMTEKPLALKVQDANAMARAAREADIRVVVNYDTTWYPSVQTAMTLAVDTRCVGEIYKVVCRDGLVHGPESSPQFEHWLSSAESGGALTDFGCYGVLQSAYLAGFHRPTAVTAWTRTVRPDLYPNCPDEALIIVEYPQLVALVEASWNWPRERKELEILGRTGELLVLDPKTLVYRDSDYHLDGQPTTTPVSRSVPLVAQPENEANELSYFAAVIRGQIRVSGMSSIEANIVVTEILAAARNSAEKGQRIAL